MIVSGAHNNIIGTNGDGNNDNIEGNVISASGHSGVWIDGANATTLAGNYVGTDASGTFAIPNAHRGIGVAVNAVGTRIGTNGDGQSDSFERNIISGNYNHNVTVTGSGVLNTIIAGNYIGTNASGSGEITQTDNLGIWIENGAKNTRVGTDGSPDASMQVKVMSSVVIGGME